jgi:pyroglutamyl-peptidase
MNTNSSPLILVTGFEPFGGMDYNPSQVIAHAMNDKIFPGITVRGVSLPVDCEKLPGLLDKLYDELQPTAVISLGLAAGRASIALERVALNLLDWEGTDNAGHTRRDTPILPEGPAAYFATLPLRTIQKELANATIPAYLSETAGLYLCNQTLYLTAHYSATKRPEMRFGFIHLPAVPQMSVGKATVTMATMSIELQTKAVEIILDIVAKILT